VLQKRLNLEDVAPWGRPRSSSNLPRAPSERQRAVSWLLFLAAKSFGEGLDSQ